MLWATWQAFSLMLWTKDPWRSGCRGSRPPSDLEAIRERSLRPMRTRTLLARIERAEQVAKAQSKFASECICFPGPEPPLFLYPIQQEVALVEVMCRFHGARPQPFYQLYMAKCPRENNVKYRLSTLAAWHHKACNAAVGPEVG